MMENSEFWLKHEYSDGIQSYLVCPDSMGRGLYGQTELTYLLYDEGRENSYRSDWYCRSRSGPANYVRGLLASPSKIENKTDAANYYLKLGDGLKYAAALIMDYSFRKQNESLNELLMLCMGAQYFTLVTSDFFPAKELIAVKISRFYANVVLGEQEKAHKLFMEVSNTIETISNQQHTRSSIILGNIRSLFFLRSGAEIKTILEINKLLVEKSRNLGDNSLTAILLLNRARLTRLQGQTSKAINILHESFSLINDINLFKIKFYYALQSAVFTARMPQLIEKLESCRAYFGGDLECFGWRIAKLLKPNAKADMLMGVWPMRLSEICLMGTSPNYILEEILSLEL